jgi:hypothetical protein
MVIKPLSASGRGLERGSIFEPFAVYIEIIGLAGNKAEELSGDFINAK